MANIGATQARFLRAGVNGSARRRGRALARWAQLLRTPLGLTAGLLLAAVLLMAFLAPLLWSEQASLIDTNSLSQGPSAEHWLGTDMLGRDIFYRVLVATRLSIQLALLATSIGVATGVLLGSIPWLLGRRAGRWAVAVINIAIAFPSLLLVLFFAVIFGLGVKGAVLAIGFAFAPYFARITYTLVAGVQQREYVAAAQIAGVSRVRNLRRHILPNIGEPLIVNTTLGAGSALLAFAWLSFLGLGVQAPSYDWGLLLNEGLNGIYLSPAGALAPAVAIIVAGLAFNLFGEALAKHIGLRTSNVAATSAYTLAAEADDEPAAEREGPNNHHPGDATGPVLIAEDLSVSVPGAGGVVTPVRGVSFTISAGKAVGVVGESGSGKSLTALAVAQLIESPGRVDAGRLEFRGTNLLGAPARGIGRMLGTSLGVVFQDPTTSLNPTMRIGRQLAEVGTHHLDMNRRQAMSRAIDRLKGARVPAPERRAHQYPHEFSGGMRQRAMIAMSMMGNPKLIVADEPTTALDVTVQRQVLRLLTEIRTTTDAAILLISHDITVVGQVCDRVLVMYAGRIVEDLPAGELRARAQHPYTRALLAAVPDMTADRDQPLAIIPGRPVDPAHFPPGCAFADRCPLADEHCRTDDPPLVADNIGRRVACWHAGEPLPDTSRPAEPVDSVGVSESR